MRPLVSNKPRPSRPPGLAPGGFRLSKMCPKGFHRLRRPARRKRVSSISAHYLRRKQYVKSVRRPEISENFRRAALPFASKRPEGFLTPCARRTLRPAGFSAGALSRHRHPEKACTRWGLPVTGRRYAPTGGSGPGNSRGRRGPEGVTRPGPGIAKFIPRPDMTGARKHGTMKWLHLARETGQYTGEKDTVRWKSIENPQGFSMRRKWHCVRLKFCGISGRRTD